MKKKKSRGKKGLISKVDVPSGMTVDQVFTHPAFVDMSKRLEEVKDMLHGLPEAIGRGVAAAINQSSLPTSGPKIPLMSTKDVKISLDTLSIDGKNYENKTRKERALKNG